MPVVLVCIIEIMDKDKGRFDLLYNILYPLDKLLINRYLCISVISPEEFINTYYPCRFLLLSSPNTFNCSAFSLCKYKQINIMSLICIFY